MKNHPFAISRMAICLFTVLILWACTQNPGPKNRTTTCLSDSSRVHALVSSVDSVMMIAGDLDEGYIRLNQALKLFAECPALKHTDDYVLALNNMGVYWIFKEGDYQKGILYFRLALQQAIELHGESYSEIPAYYNNIGFVYDATGSYDSAEYCFTKALLLWNTDSIKNADVLGKCYANLNSLNQKQGRLEKALEYAYRSYDIRKRLYGEQHAETGEAHTNIGNTLLGMDHPQEALEEFKRAESIFLQESTPTQRHLFNTYSNIGSTYYKLKNLDKSNEYYAKALVTAQNSDVSEDHPDFALLFSNIALNQQEQGDYDQAMANYQKALAIFTRSKGANSIDVAITHGQIGTLQELRHAYPAALKSYLAQLAIIRAGGGLYQPEMEHCFRLLGGVYSHMGNHALAFLYTDSAMAVKDSIQSQNRIRSLSEMRVQYETEIRQKEIVALNAKNELAQAQIGTRNLLLFFGFLLFGIVLFTTVWILLAKRQRDKLRFENQVQSSELKALRSQLNPHFIFNSLNAIRLYINDHESNLADEFLLRYASLMRQILDQSEDALISLQKELDTLALYLDLEKQRLENGFEYCIETDPSINLAHTAFPSLTLQPFAENAVKHAFDGESGHGELHIQIGLKENLLHITITDNGPGMSPTAKKQASHGMRISQNRIENYAAKQHTKAAFEVTSSAQGTHISFVLPLVRI